MIFALLFYNDEARFAALTRSERNALVERHITFNTSVLQPRALMMVNRALQPTQTARTVWPRPDGAEIAAGPFAQPSLSLSGFYLIDCDDLDEATKLAAQYPMPEGLGCVEVRPALEAWDYAPSIDLDATSPDQPWQIYTDVDRWQEWLPAITAASISGPGRPGATGTIQFRGQPAARLTVDAWEPEHRLAVQLDFAGADARLGLEFVIDPLPRGAVRISHRAEIPRNLLDTVGTDFSGHLNHQLRDGLRLVAERIRSMEATLS